jgi:hypothetical protein
VGPGAPSLLALLAVAKIANVLGYLAEARQAAPL